MKQKEKLTGFNTVYVMVKKHNVVFFWDAGDSEYDGVSIKQL